jgi:hypothetical protein
MVQVASIAGADPMIFPVHNLYDLSTAFVHVIPEIARTSAQTLLPPAVVS